MSEATAAAKTGDTGTTVAASWHTGLDPEVLGHIQSKGWSLDDPKAVVAEATKAYKNVEKHFGAPPNEMLRIAKPTDEAAWKAMHLKLGAPADPKEYSFDGIKRADGSDLAPAFVDAMRAAMGANFIPKDRAPEITKAIVKHLDDTVAQEAAIRTDAVKTERDALLKSWGTQAEFNRLQAMQGARRLGVGPEDVAKLENVVGYSRIMEMFRKIGAGTTEDTFVEGKTSGTPATTQAAQSRLDELMADKAWAKRLTEGGSAERREFDALTKQISGYVEAA